MKKAVGIILLVGSLLWCFLVLPLSLVPAASLIYQHELLTPIQNWILGERRTVAKLIFSVLVPFVVLKFGLSLIRSSLNMITGNREETQRERFRSLVEKKLKSENASNAAKAPENDAR